MAIFPKIQRPCPHRDNLAAIMVGGVTDPRKVEYVEAGRPGLARTARRFRRRRKQSAGPRRRIT